MNDLLNKLNDMQSQHIQELEKRIEKLLKQLNEIQKDNIKARECLKELKEQTQIQPETPIKGS